MTALGHNDGEKSIHLTEEPKVLTVLFIKKLIIILIASSILIGSVYYYFWILKTSYYFPGRYETAFICMSSTILFCSCVAVIVIIHHYITRNTKSKKG